jgi:hypothetical protein
VSITTRNQRVLKRRLGNPLAVTLPLLQRAGVATAIVLFAGCGSGIQVGTPVRQAAAQRGFSAQLIGHSPTFATTTVPVVVHPDHEKSWMLPNARAGRRQLLYVSDIGTDDVNVYLYASGTQIGALTGFNEPQGECVDSSDDVYITNTESSEILEYAYGATVPKKTIFDANQYPVGCSYDAETGELAVSNILAAGSNPGSVSLYAKGKGSPKIIQSPSFAGVFYLGYDNKGNLFLDGLNPDDTFEYGELPKGRSSISPITVSGATIAFPGGVQWDGHKMTVGDQEGPIYQIKDNGDIVGTTTLSGACDVVQYFVLDSKITAPDSCNENADVYAYPGGGPPIVKTGNLRTPIGASVISNGK